MTDKDMIDRVSAVGVMGNVALVVFKLFAGLVGRSSAMVSDAIHSLSDVLATLVAYLGVTFSETPADKDHPYGHEQIENLASIAIGLTLLATGGALCYGGLTKTCAIYSANRACATASATTETSASVDAGANDSASGDSDVPAVPVPAVPTLLPVIAAIVSILTKEAMFWYTIYYARRLKSSAFEADAWHHRSDAFSSIGSLIGIVGARMGFPILDPIASIIISGFILKVAYDILRNSALASVDTSAGEATESEMRALIEQNPYVEHIDLLRTRKFGARVYVETEIAVDGNKTLYVAHRVAHEVHNAVEGAFPSVKHVMVHVNPSQLDDTDAQVTGSRGVLSLDCGSCAADRPEQT